MQQTTARGCVEVELYVWHLAEALVGVGVELANALKSPFPADLLSDPLETGVETGQSRGRDGDCLVASCAVGSLEGHIVADHAVLHAEVGHKALLEKVETVSADKERARAIGAAQPLLARASIGIDA